MSKICWAVRPSEDSLSAVMPVNPPYVSVRTRIRQKEAKIELLIAAMQHTAHPLIAARFGKATGEAATGPG